MTAILWIELLLELGVTSFVAWLLVSQVGMAMMLLWCLPLGALFALRIGFVLVPAVLSMQSQQQPSLAAAVRVSWLWHEFLALLRFNWLMLTEWPGVARSAATDQAGPQQPLVVLLHGVYCNRAIWRPVLRYLRARSQCEFVAPNLTPVWASLDVQAQRFAHWLNHMVRQRPHAPVILVGYSMGGLIARICIAQKLIHVPIQRLVCIATPHAGSRLANFLPGAVAADLRIGSVILTKLNRIKADPMPAIVNLYSRHDTMIVPYQSAHLLNARNEAVEAIGHTSLVYSPQVRSAILRELASAQPAQATS